MKKIIAVFMALVLILSACGEPGELMEFTMEDRGDVAVLVYGDRVYRPFCVVSKRDCGELLGYVDGDADWHVCRYKELPVEQWVADYLTMDGGAMLWREEGTGDIPEGLVQEYG